MNSNIIVIGAGGHAKVCIEILKAMGETIDYCVGSTESPKFCLQVPVLIGDEQLIHLYAQGYRKVFIALGANHLRAKLAEYVEGIGYQLVNAISPQSCISPSVKMASGIAVMPGAIINAESAIEELAIINTGATIDHDCAIGRAAHIAPQCALAGNVSIGAETFIGLGTKIIPNVVIGNNVIIGAASLIIRNIPNDCKAFGAPAKIIASEPLELH